VTRKRSSARQGFSLVELLLAMTIVLVIMAGVFVAIGPSTEAFSMEPEVADQQQRVRVVADAIARDLRAAGRGGSRSGSGLLIDQFAAILPFRQGRRLADPPGTFRTDALTLLSATSDAVYTTLAQPLPAADASVRINLDPGCQVFDPSCGFRVGMDVVVFDGTGAFDTFAIAAVQMDLLTLDHHMADSGVVYPVGATIAEAASRTYFHKADPATGTFQLIQYDGGSAGDSPVADHVVSLRFDYQGEPRPPAMRIPLGDPFGPWTTYGPKPPLPGVPTSGYPPGENCAFTLDAAQLPVSRLAALGAGSPGLVPLGAAELTDGPWCPDAASPTRYDADLLRVRAVSVTVRVEAAAGTLRGAGGSLFVRPGQSPGPPRWLPDRELRFTITPRNQNVFR
jgi:prepilin-type N-terminal cleavage/methylation domain-containing protein